MSSTSSEFVKKIVKAGAGAGKTHDLIEKIFRMVFEYAELNDGKSPQIIVCTFTRKATQELRERLLKKAILLKAENEQKSKIALNFLRKSNALHVSTIHGVLSLFLKKFGQSINLDSNFKIVENVECFNLRKNLFWSLLKKNDLQTKEVFKLWKWEELSLIIQKYREVQSLNPQIKIIKSELIIDLLKKQKVELELELQKLLDAFHIYTDEKKETAINNFCKGIKNFLNVMHECSLPIDELEKLNHLANMYELIPQKLGAMKNVDAEAKELKKELHQKMKDFFQDPYLKSMVLTDYEQQISLLDEWLQQFSKELLSLKISKGELTSADLEIISSYIIHTQPIAAEQFATEYDYWFIDEFQDTSPHQLFLLKKLIGAKSYYLVGDPQQSIYYFRGARSDIFKKEWHHLLNLGHTTEVKTLNRRSDFDLLNFINDFMVSLNPVQFNKMEALPQLIQSAYPIVTIDITAPLQTDIEAKELENIAFRIDYLRDLQIEFSKICILCRENGDVKKIVQFLKSKKYPVQSFSKGNFFQNKWVIEALVLYKFLLNPHNDLNLIQLLNHIDKNKELHLESILHFQVKNKIVSLWKTILDNNKEIRITQILMQCHEQASQVGLLKTWLLCLEKLDYLSVDAGADESGLQQTVIWQLYDYLSENDDLNLENELSELPGLYEQNAINVMTIHASKGLEFDHIFLPFLNKQMLRDGPDHLTVDDESNYYSTPMVSYPQGTKNYPNWCYNIKEHDFDQLTKEQERLLYVAVTRAKKTISFFINSDDENSKSIWINHLKNFLKPESGTYQSQGSGYSLLVDYKK